MTELESILKKTRDRPLHVLAEIYNQTNTIQNRWYSVRENKKEIMSNLDMKLSTLNKHLADLKRRGFIYSIERGVYSLDLSDFNILLKDNSIRVK